MFENLKEKIRKWNEKKEFLQQVDENTKSLRRKAYFEQKKIQASEEGKIIAKKELEKRRQELEKEKQRTQGTSGDMFKSTQDWSHLDSNKNNRRKRKNG